MIGFIRGKIIDVDYGTSKIIVEVNNIGYIVTVTAVLLEEYTLGNEIELITQPEIREDTFDLFGFLSVKDKNFYKKIRSVNGVGPRTALNIMSMPVEDLIQAIEEENVKKISTIQGLGKKTAERLILELKGNLPRSSDEPNIKSIINKNVSGALEGLGYKQKEISDILDTAPKDVTDEQDLIKYFLRNIR
jgi:Holliday junction DNA helicase RuvA